jgi:hypothetical protein
MSRAESWLEADPKRVAGAVVAFSGGVSLLLALGVAVLDTRWYFANVPQLISTLIQALGTVLAIVFSITIFGVDTGDSSYPRAIESIHFYSWTYYVTIALFFTAILVDVVVQLLGEQALPINWLWESAVIFAISFSVLTLFWVPLYSLYIARWRSPSDKLEIWYGKQPAVEVRETNEARDIIETLANVALAGVSDEDKSTALKASNRLKETLEGMREQATISEELADETSVYIREIAGEARKAELRELYRRVSWLFVVLFAWAIEAADETALRGLLNEYTQLIYDSSKMEFSTYQLPVYEHLTSAIKQVDKDELNDSGIVQLRYVIDAGVRVMQYFRGGASPYERSRVVETFLDFCYQVHRLLIFSHDLPDSSEWDLFRPDEPLELALDRLLDALASGIHELIAVHSDASGESRLMPPETSLRILNSILTESRLGRCPCNSNERVLS